ncbi:glycosyltransferase family 4 protein [Cellulosilyticum sp. ST5]|uniref:glycosyltransferase family 4 protein n=1 Tax=Cellulosilyticum sp. ST5 TaxID=3055805 RepID=UPI0039777510
MINLYFKTKYKVVHITNEIGNYVIGGMGTYINELYKHRDGETGFIHIHNNAYTDIDIGSFPGFYDILSMTYDEGYKIEDLECDIVVIHFYELAFCVTEKIISSKKVVYVIHSVPLPEPPPKDDPFGGNLNIKQNFEYMCENAHQLICVSYAERNRLLNIYPQYDRKTKVIHNGITLAFEEIKNKRTAHKKKIFGYIGRMDYRKGILECIKAFKDIDGELRIACANNDPYYFSTLLQYIEAANMNDKVRFMGWCMGARKDSFLNSLDALIIPSLYEPFGYVVVEGMKWGIPIISSRNGGISEIIQDYKYQYDAYEQDELIDIIKLFQKDSDEYINKEVTYLEVQLQNFTVEKMIEKYVETWRELLES